MMEALKEANKALLKEEVPVGAVLVVNDEIVIRAHNLKEIKQNPLYHAEILAIKSFSNKKKSWRLENTTLYVTLEPCIMCAGAIIQARIPRLVYGADDLKAGSVKSLYNLLDDKRLNHRVDVLSGICEKECSNILKEFFDKIRKKRRDG